MYYEIVEMTDETLLKEIKLPSGENTYRLTAFFYKDYDFVEQTEITEVKTDYALEVDAPSFISSGDRVAMAIHYKALDGCVLSIKLRDENVTSQSVKGHGVIEFEVDRSGAYRIDMLKNDGSIIKSESFEIKKPGEAKVQVSQVVLAKRETLLRAMYPFTRSLYI